jgi:hypothetical protein
MRIREWIARLLFVASLAYAGVSIYLFHETRHVKAGEYGVLLAVAVMAGCLIYELALSDSQVRTKMVGDAGPEIDLRDRLVEQGAAESDRERVRA